MDGGRFDSRAGDRGRDFFDAGGNGEIGWVTVLAFDNLDTDRRDDSGWSVVLRRTRGTLS